MERREPAPVGVSGTGRYRPGDCSGGQISQQFRLAPADLSAGMIGLDRGEPGHDVLDRHAGGDDCDRSGLRLRGLVSPR